MRPPQAGGDVILTGTASAVLRRYSDFLWLYERLHALKNLEEIYLDGSNITDKDLSHLSLPTKVKMLSFSACEGLSGQSVPYLARMNHLKVLDLSENDHLNADFYEKIEHSLAKTQVKK